MENLVIPDEFKNRGDDLVSYKCVMPDHYSSNKVVTQDNPSAACYHNCMAQLSTTEFFLRPIKTSALPFDIFARWVDLTRQNGLMPPEVVATREDQCNLLHIPSRQHNRHIVYAGLCCYRWSENQPGLAYSVVKILDENPRLDFFQAFHYGAAQKLYWLIHSVTHIMASQGVGVYGTRQTHNRFLPYSLMMARFFRPDPSGVSEAVRLKHVPNTLDSVANCLYVTEKISSTPEDPMVLKSINHVLAEEVTPLFGRVETGTLRQAVINTIGNLK